MFATFSSSQTEPLEKAMETGATHADERQTTQLIGVFDACRCWLCHDDVTLVLREQVLESSFFLGDAWIQPPHEMGLRGCGVKFDDDDLWCSGQHCEFFFLHGKTVFRS